MEARLLSDGRVVRGPSGESGFFHDLYLYMGGILRNIKSPLIEIGGIADHVHLLVSLGREASVAPLVRDVKANSSRWIHEKFPQRSAFAWQAGYGAFAVSFSGVAAV